MNRPHGLAPPGLHTAPSILGRAGSAGRRAPGESEEECERLTEAARLGDQRAFTAIVERYWNTLTTYLLRLTNDPEAARDLAQETFVQAFRAIGDTSPGLQVRSWLYRIATNLSYNHLKRRQRFVWLPLRVLERQPVRDDTASIEESVLIHSALSRLRPDDRVVLLLCGGEGLTYSEAAAVLGSSREAVRKRFVRAAERFRRVYGE